MENSFGQNKRAKIKKKVFQILTHAVLILCSISMLIPFLWMISSSLKDVQELYAIPPYWIPKHVAWENYVYMFEQAPWFVYFGNTIFITVFTILGQLITCSMAAYAFARLNFKGKNILWVKPINDFLACSNVLPSLNAVDIPFGASYFAKMAYVLAGEEIPENWNTILNERMDSCHFEYPTSTHAIRSYSPGDCYIRNTDEQAYTGKRSLKLTAVTSSGEESFFYKQTYYSSEDFDDSRYDPFFAPLVYPGQTVHLSVMPLPGEEMATTAQIYAKNGVTGEVIRGEKVKGDGEWHALSLEIPGGQTGHISEVGVILCGVAKGFAMGDVAAYIDDLYFDGKPDYRLDFGRMKLDSWHVTHQEVPQFAKLKGHSYLDGQYLSLSCADFAEMYTGHHLWNNYRVTAVLKPVTSTEHFVNIRVQGAMRSYAAGFSKNNKLVLRKNYYGYITLCETDFEWKVDEEYKISLTADGSTISVSVNDKEYLKFTDSDLPLLTGCAGISVEKGSHCLYRDIAITGRE